MLIIFIWPHRSWYYSFTLPFKQIWQGRRNLQRKVLPSESLMFLQWEGCNSSHFNPDPSCWFDVLDRGGHYHCWTGDRTPSPGSGLYLFIGVISGAECWLTMGQDRRDTDTTLHIGSAELQSNTEYRFRYRFVSPDFHLYVAFTWQEKIARLLLLNFYLRRKKQSFEINYNSDNYEVLLIAS